MCLPHPEPSSHLPPTLSLWVVRALALGDLLHELTLHWSSILHMVMCIFQCYSLKSSHPCLWEGNRQEGQGSPNRGNRLQVSDIFFSLPYVAGWNKLELSVFFSSLKILCCHDDTWFHMNLTFLKPWANQCVFLMEMFFLSYVNEAIYSLWNLPFFKMVPSKD